MLVLVRQVDEWIMIGDDLLVGPFLIDSHRIRLTVNGRVLGGAQDGAPFTKTIDLSTDAELELAPNVSVRVVQILPPKVRIGVVAPKTISIHRKEVYDAIRRANEENR